MDLLKESPTSHRKNLHSARWLARREATAEQSSSSMLSSHGMLL